MLARPRYELRERSHPTDSRGYGPRDLDPAAWADPALARILWIDRAAARLRLQRDKLGTPLARAARSLVSQRLWNVFGHARLEDHAAENYGRSGRWVRDLAVLGEGLERLPGLEEALTGADGKAPIGRSAAIPICRVASAESLSAWLALARSASVRDLLEAVREARRQDSDSPVDDEPADRETRTEDDAPRREVEASPEQSADQKTEIEDDAPRCEVELDVPPALRVAFDETLELHRASCGSQVGMTSFIEAIVAESQTGAMPADIERVPLVRARPIDAIERQLARSADDWSWLDSAKLPDLPKRRDPVFDRLWERSSRLLVEAGKLGQAAGSGSPGEIDRRLRDLIQLEDRLERHLGRLMSYLGRKRAWSRLQFSGAGHYGDHRLGVSRRTAVDRTRAARDLRRLPILRGAYESGQLGLEAVLQVLRVIGPDPVTPAVERSWVKRASEVNIKRLREETRAAVREGLCLGPGEHPAPPSDAEWSRSVGMFPGTIRRRFARLAGVAEEAARNEVVIRFWLRLPENLATDLLAAIEDRRSQLDDAARTFSALPESPESFPDDGAHPSPIAGSALADEGPDPRPSVTSGPRSAREACRLAARGLLPAESPELASATPLAMRAARRFRARGRPTPTWVGLMALLEEYVATWDDPELMPPRAENQIHSRNGWRCAAPCCTSRRNLEAHHIQYRSHGGDDDPSNMTSLCRWHHQRGEHGGLASCKGRAPLGVTWGLGREDVRVHYRNERRL